MISAVATSTTLRRRWSSDGETRHHLIDPHTGMASDTDVNLAAVVARNRYQAEDALLTTRRSRLQAAVRLFRALGGGFEAGAGDRRS